MRFLLIASLLAMGLADGALAADTPKRGGILTYMIAADGGPSLDGHQGNDLRGAARDGAVLFDADAGQSGQPILHHRISFAICAPKCRRRPMAA